MLLRRVYILGYNGIAGTANALANHQALAAGLRALTTEYQVLKGAGVSLPAGAH